MFCDVKTPEGASREIRAVLERMVQKAADEGTSSTSGPSWSFSTSRTRMAPRCSTAELFRPHLARLRLRPAPRHGAHAREDGHTRGVLHHEKGPVSARDRLALRGRPALHGGRCDDLQTGGEGDRAQDGVYASFMPADERRAGQRHACAPEPVRPRRQQRVFRRERPVGLQPLRTSQSATSRAF